TGVDVTVKKTSADTLTVSVVKDPEAIATKVQALVDAINDALARVRTATRYDAATNTVSVLTGDPTARRVGMALTRALLDEVGTSSLGAPGLAGISIDKHGTVTFDKARFLEAYEDDPDAVRALFVTSSEETPAIADRLIVAVDAATERGTGYLRTAEELRLDRAEQMADRITKLEERLERTALMLRKKFADMEAALGTLRQQGEWLAGQIASLQPAQK
ncbi:MAG TPA: flagellar filament capping protein FliD, partial [Acidimicrobiales bacterium]